MGCITSKNNGSVVSPTADGCAPRVSRTCTALSFSKSLTRRQSGRSEDVNREKVEGSSCRSVSRISGQLMRRSKRGSSGNNDSFSVKSGPAYRLVEGEQVAAGWPPWLSSAAGEAVDGWLPLRADAYEKLEKIGQGTYSSVFRAREVKTGKTVALKKVRFDNLQPESIRFMAREIMILRRLDHPNIMKLEGVITSPVSSSLYLVFEYMDHDLSGLNSCPYVKFTEAQVKCFMKQLISGIEHCHSKGIMHRDIKASNILVSSQGILKIADFGLANFITPKNRNQLTSRVVTLWYRPPELLLGTTSYEVTIDLWSVGCVFAELLIRKPLLKGRTEVEQLHKIFKLCGSPPEDYWRNIHHSPMYRPYHGSCLRERFRELPEPTVDLLETLLSVEPQKRGTASSALMSEYFNTKPYPCNPSSLPKYPPNKEMDAKLRDELRRKRNRLRARDSGATRKQIKPSISYTCTSQKADMNRRSAPFPMKINIKPKDGAVQGRDPILSAADTMSEASEATTVISQADIYTAPLEIPGSTNFSWAKKRKDSSLSTLSYSSLGSRSIASTADSESFNFSNNPFNKITEGKKYDPGNVEATNPVLKKIQEQFEQQHEFEHDEPYEFEQDDPDDDVRIEQLPRNRSLASRSLKPADAIKKNMGKPELSGPLIFHQHKIDQLLQRNEDHIRQKSRFENTEK